MLALELVLVYFAILIVSTTAAPVDQNATVETKLLFNHLKNITNNTGKIMFGHQQDTMMGAYGFHNPYWKLGSPHDGGIQGWLFQPGQVDSNSEDELSDIKSVTGEYPAVIGFDVGGTFSADDRKRSAYLIKKASDRGLLITIAWHLSNPVSDGSPWVNKDKTGKDIRHSIRRILPNGDVHSKFKEILDGVAEFINSLKDSHGSTVPVIFRPYHEMNGGWFWWGTSSKTENTPDDFKQLFQFTVHYLRDIRHVHNILFAYSPDKPFNTANEYLKFYPGDEYVDMLGLDYYFARPFYPAVSDFQHKMQILTDLAHSKGKLAALTETGIFSNGLESHHSFWSDHILYPIKSGHGTARICYIHAWLNICNSQSCEIWVPYKGHPAENEFLSHFYKDLVTIFGSTNGNIHPPDIG